METLVAELRDQIAMLQRENSILHQNEERYMQFLENMHGGLVVHGPDTRIIFCNLNSSKLLGLTTDQMAGKADIDPAWSFLREDGSILPIEEYPVNVVIRTGKPLVNKVYGINRVSRGDRVWVLANAFPVLNTSGELQQVAVTFVDITALKRAEKVMLENEKRLNRSQEIAHLGSWELDLLTNTLSWSDEVYRIFGLKPQEFDATYEAFLDAVHPDDRAAVNAAYSSSIEEGKNYYEINHRIISKSTGEIRYVHEKCQHIRDSNGKIIRSIGMVHDITDRVLAEQALDEAHKRTVLLSRFPDENPNPVARVSADGVVLYHNPVVDAYKWDLKVGLPAPDYMLSIIKQAMQEGKEVVREIKLAGKYFSVSGMPFRNENYVNIYGLDITERVLAESALRETEERFRQLADAMPQLVWTARPDGTVDYYNRRAEEYEGFTRNEEHTWDWSPVLHPDDIEDTLEEWQSAVETGDVYQIEHRVRMANGTYRWHLSRGVPYMGEDGKIIKWFGTATDIHVQKEVEESLRLSERRLRRLVDANIIGVFYRRADGKVYEANDFFLQLIGSSREDLEAGKVNWRKITPPEYWPIDERAIGEAKDHGYCKPYEKEYIRRDGSRVPILIGHALLDNSTDDFVAFIMDLSELKEAQKTAEEYARRLESSNQELENFAFIASHDMQEPLRKIISFGERLKIRLKSQVSEEDLEFLKRMQDASRRMQIMIDDLLQLSRISTHGHPFAPVDLNAVAGDVLLDLEYRLRESEGEVVLENLPEIEADEIQMHHLLQNLIGNAIKYRKPGQPARVKVSAKAENNHKSDIIQIFVEDNGIGFDEVHKDRIFRVFERLVGRSEYEGSGMGLAICKKIVERHGGTITAKSKPDVGSTFIVTLPLKQYS